MINFIKEIECLAESSDTINLNSTPSSLRNKYNYSNSLSPYSLANLTKSYVREQMMSKKASIINCKTKAKIFNIRIDHCYKFNDSYNEHIEKYYIQPSNRFFFQYIVSVSWSCNLYFRDDN